MSAARNRLSRYCQRCRRWRAVDWRNPGSPIYCQDCQALVDNNVPTEAQKKARRRRTTRKQQRVAEVLVWLNEFKATQGCLHCDEKDPSALDCHHKNPVHKKMDISTLIRRTPTLPILLKELSKCVVICASCHRKHHHHKRAAKQLKQQDLAMLEDHAAPELSDLGVLEGRREALVTALSHVDNDLGACRKISDPRCAEVERERRAIIAALVKIDAEIVKLRAAPTRQPIVMVEAASAFGADDDVDRDLEALINEI